MTIRRLPIGPYFTVSICPHLSQDNIEDCEMLAAMLHNEGHDLVRDTEHLHIIKRAKDADDLLVFMRACVACCAQSPWHAEA